MENRSFALATGLFLLGLITAAVVTGSWLSGNQKSRTAYRVVSTGSVTGLNPQGQVRYRGISVGRVQRIQLDPADTRRILIEVEVDSETPITRGTYAQLGQEGITGIAYVHLLEEGKDKSAPVASPDGVVEIAMRSSAMDDIFETAAGVAKDAKEVAASLNALLSNDNRRNVGAVLVSLEKASANLAVASQKLPGALARADRGLQSVLSDENVRRTSESLQRMSEAAKEFPLIAAESRKLVEDARQLVAQAGRLAGEAQGATGAVRRETLPRVNALAETVERGAERIGRLATELERRPDSVVWGRPGGRPGPGESGFE
jgi:phospholipid/cholesterol/gamma-HCH transport system substrate-binding protein